METAYTPMRESVAATMEEIMEGAKPCIAQRAQSCNLGVPVLAEGKAAVSEVVVRP